jgi:hypothetical protein
VSVKVRTIQKNCLSGALLWLYTATTLLSSRLDIVAGLLQLLLRYALKIFVEVVSGFLQIVAQILVRLFFTCKCSCSASEAEAYLQRKKA